jgi:hypothetical protein
VGAQAGLFNRSEGCWFEVEVGCIAGPVEGLAIAVVGEQFDLDLALGNLCTSQQAASFLNKL